MKRITLFFLALSCGLGAAWAKKTQIAGIDDGRRSGTLYRLYNEVPFGGYFPLQLRLENRTNDEEEWSLVTRSNLDRQGSAVLSFAKNFKVAPHSVAVFEVLVPMPSVSDIEAPRFSGQLFDFLYLSVEGSLIGPKQERSFNCSSSSKIEFHSSSGADWEWNPVRIVGYDPSSDVYLPKDVLGRGGKPIRSGDQPGYQLIELDLEAMSGDWRAYWGFGLIYLTTWQWEKMGILQQQAVMQWVRAGGALVLPGWNHWARGASIPGLKKSDFVSGVAYHGLGRVQLGEGKGYVETLYDVQLEGAFPLTNPNLVSLDKYSLDPVVNLSGYYVALLLFIVLIGPVNVMWLCRGSKRYRVFITTPLIVASCIALLFLYTVLRDGLGGDGERLRLSLFGGGLNQAMRLQTQGAETGLILNRSFDVPVKSRFESFYVSGASQRRFDVREDRFDGDWFRSRSKQAQLLAWTEASREGVQLEPSTDGGGVVVSSRIKGMVKPFVYKDSSDAYWYAESLSLGEKKELEPIKEEKALAHLKRISEGVGETFLSKLAARQLRARNVFFGELTNDPSEMVESLDSIEWVDGTHLAVGSVSKSVEGGL